MRFHTGAFQITTLRLIATGSDRRQNFWFEPMRLKTKSTPYLLSGVLFKFYLRPSYNGDIYRRGSLIALFDFKGHPIAFLERLKAISIDPGKVYKHIGTVFLGDKAIPLFVAEPFDNTVRHSGSPLSKNC